MNARFLEWADECYEEFVWLLAQIGNVIIWAFLIPIAFVLCSAPVIIGYVVKLIRTRFTNQ